MKKKILLLSLSIVTVISLFGFIFVPKVEAATTYGFGLASRPLTIYAGGELSTSQINILKDAINSWNSTRFGTFFVYGGVKRVYNPIKADGWSTVTIGNLDVGVGGQTRTVTNGYSIVEANSIINSNNYTKSTVMHELGHALGLDDNTDIGSVMCFVNYNSVTITQSDLNDLDTLY